MKSIVFINSTRHVVIYIYNDTRLKEILADGITTISTDFEHMGKRIAELILGKTAEKVSKNPFKMTVRKTL